MSWYPRGISWQEQNPFNKYKTKWSQWTWTSGCDRSNRRLWYASSIFVIWHFVVLLKEYNIFSSPCLVSQLSWPSWLFRIGFWYVDSSYSDLSVSCVLLRLLGITGCWSDWVAGGGGGFSIWSGSTLPLTAWLQVIKTQRKTIRGKTDRNPMKSRLWLIETPSSTGTLMK